MRINSWDGKIEKTWLQYECEIENDYTKDIRTESVSSVGKVYSDEELIADKYDCMIAAGSGLLTAAIDVLWVGEFSLRYAQNVGTDQINGLVIKIAQAKGCKKNDLKGCIKYLEKECPLAADKLTSEFGYGQHHLRDFSHHASPIGLVCSILNQFLQKGYGTDTEGNLVTPDIPETDLLGKNFEEKIFNGVIGWIFHLISDMAGSSSSVGRGTGVPGPILSLLKYISSNRLFKELTIAYKNDEIGFSVWVSKLFNGTAFAHTSNKDLVRFDLRTELGIYNFGARQSIPVIVNQCIVRGFYMFRKLAQECSKNNIEKLMDLKRVRPKMFLPYKDNRCIARMITVSTGTFTVIDGMDAAIRTKIKNPANKADFVSNLLLRLNFVGIGAFAFAIKNEVEYAAADIKGFLNKKTKAGMLKESGVLKKQQISQTIEIEVDMDNRNLYTYTFDGLLDSVRKSRETLIKNHDSYNNQIKMLIDLGDGEYGVYKSIVEANEVRVSNAIETLVIKLFEQNDITFEDYPISEKYCNCSYEIRSKSRPFQIIRKEHGKSIGYIFSDSSANDDWVTYYQKGELSVDGLVFVCLKLYDNESYDLFIRKQNEAYQKNGVDIELITVEELFLRFFDKEEYSVFADYVNEFNAKTKEIIGYCVIPTPTDEAIKRFKNNTGIMLQNYPYKNYIPSVIYESQIDILLKNYINRELWKAMVGNANFAISFISAEWNYNVYQLTENLDLTGVVAGYLKSVEQLLFKVIGLYKDKGITVQAKDGKIIELSANNEELMGSTLGNLESVILHNNKLLDVNPYVKKYLIETIDDWRNKQRNGYFHKHNLCSIEKVKEIREKAIYLYFLILGACSIEDSQFADIGINGAVEEDTKPGLVYDALVQWIEPILDNNLPKDGVAICFTLYGTKNNLWDLQLTVTNYFDKSDEKWTWSSIFSSGHDVYSWKDSADEKKVISEVAQVICRYIESGAQAHKLACYKAIAVSGQRYTKILYENGAVLV